MLFPQNAQNVVTPGMMTRMFPPLMMLLIQAYRNPFFYASEENHSLVPTLAKPKPAYGGFPFIT
jgi:hypothetical protein